MWFHYRDIIWNDLMTHGHISGSKPSFMSFNILISDGVSLVEVQRACGDSVGKRDGSLKDIQMGNNSHDWSYANLWLSLARYGRVLPFLLSSVHDENKRFVGTTTNHGIVWVGDISLMAFRPLERCWKLELCDVWLWFRW